MSANLNFNDNFLPCAVSLRYNAAHPDRKINAIWYAQFFVMHGLYTLQMCLNMYSVIANDIANDFANACANGIICLIYFIVSFMLFVMYRYKSIFLTLIDTVNGHYELSKTLTEQEQKIIAEHVHKGKIVVYGWIFLSASAFLGFVGQPIVKMAYLVMTGDFKLESIFPLHYPPFFHKINDFTLYIMMLALSIYYTSYCVATYLGVVPLGPLFMIHTCGQMELCKGKVMRLYSEEKRLTEEERQLLIADIVKQTHDIYEFVEHLKTSFMILYEMTLKGSSLIMPVLLYETLATLGQGELRIEFIILLVGAMTICSCPCYYGDMLQEKSDDLHNAFYACGWERVWDKKARASLLLILTRMQRPTVIRSIFRIVCLESLTDVFGTAYSLFNLLNAAWD